MSRAISITLRILGFALLIFAGLRFVTSDIHSFYNESSMAQADGGGYQIDHIVEINHWTLLVGLLGIVAVVMSVVMRRTKAKCLPPN